MDVVEAEVIGLNKRTRFSLLRGIPRSDFPFVAVNLAKTAISSPLSQSKWSDWRYEPTPTRFVAAWSGDVLSIADDACKIAESLSRQYECPWMELRLQEGDHWDFTLYRSGQLVADFSTRIGAFDGECDSAGPWKVGAPADLAEVWQLSLSRIERYLVDWNSLAENVSGMTRAYPDDRFTYGDCNQALDFMNAIGAVNPFASSDRIEFTAPTWQSQYHPQPLLRRIVRKLSWRFRGAYPDMPRPTAAQRRLWDQRKQYARASRVSLSEADCDDEVPVC